MIEDVLNTCSQKSVQVSVFLTNGIRLKGTVMECSGGWLWLDNAGDDCFVSLVAIASVVPSEKGVFR